MGAQGVSEGRQLEHQRFDTELSKGHSFLTFGGRRRRGMNYRIGFHAVYENVKRNPETGKVAISYRKLILDRDDVPRHWLTNHGPSEPVVESAYPGTYG